MKECPKCNSSLNGYERSTGRCSHCGAEFKAEQTTEDSKIELPEVKSDDYSNTFGTICAVIGFLIMVLGTVAAAYINLSDEYDVSLNLIFNEIRFIISGWLFVVISQVIRLLQGINNKLK